MFLELLQFVYNGGESLGEDLVSAADDEHVVLELGEVVLANVRDDQVANDVQGIL